MSTARSCNQDSQSTRVTEIMQRVTRVIVGSYIGLSILGWITRAYNIASALSTAHSDPVLLVVVTTETPKWCIWSPFTAPFVELEIIPFIFSTILLWTGGRYCEQIWSGRKYLVFVAICLLPNLLLVLVYSFVSLANGKEYRINGMASLVAGIVVALKQLVSEHVIILFKGKLRLKIKWIPLLLLILLPLLDICGLYDQYMAFFLGFLFSWGYLRFYQTLPEVSGRRTRMLSRPFIKGDASDAFSFTEFFPERFSPLISSATMPLYKLGLKARIIPEYTLQQVQSANQRYATRLSGILPLYSTQKSTNERRQAMLESLT